MDLINSMQYFSVEMLSGNLLPLLNPQAWQAPE